MKPKKTNHFYIWFEIRFFIYIFFLLVRFFVFFSFNPPISCDNILDNISCFQGWLAAADDAVIGCMPSPCVGELGAGIKKKSSANPMIIDTLGKAYVLRSRVWVKIVLL